MIHLVLKADVRIIFFIMLLLKPLITLGQNGNDRAEGDAYYHQIQVPTSSIIINGKTNVNRFDCGLKNSTLNEHIVVKNVWLNQKLEFEGLRLPFKIEDFACSLSAMNKDFYELLGSDKEPYIYLQLNAIMLKPGEQSFEELDVDAIVDIQLAGKTNTITIQNCKIYNHSAAQMTMRGNTQLSMTSFDIQPPTKVMGMVKVEDQIEIEFEIEMIVSHLKK